MSTKYSSEEFRARWATAHPDDVGTYNKTLVISAHARLLEAQKFYEEAAARLREAGEAYCREVAEARRQEAEAAAIPEAPGIQEAAAIHEAPSIHEVPAIHEVAAIHKIPSVHEAQGLPRHHEETTHGKENVQPIDPLMPAAPGKEWEYVQAAAARFRAFAANGRYGTPQSSRSSRRVPPKPGPTSKPGSTEATVDKSVTAVKTSTTPPEVRATPPKGLITPPEVSITPPEASVDPSRTSGTPTEDSADPPGTSGSPPEASVNVPKISITPPNDSVNSPNASVTSTKDFTGPPGASIPPRKKFLTEEEKIAALDDVTLYNGKLVTTTQARHLKAVEAAGAAEWIPSAEEVEKAHLLQEAEELHHLQEAEEAGRLEQATNAVTADNLHTFNQTTSLTGDNHQTACSDASVTNVAGSAGDSCDDEPENNTITSADLKLVNEKLVQMTESSNQAFEAVSSSDDHAGNDGYKICECGRVLQKSLYPITPIGKGEHYVGSVPYVGPVPFGELASHEYYPISNPKILYTFNEDSQTFELVHPDAYVELCKPKDKYPDGSHPQNRNVAESRFVVIGDGYYRRPIPKEYLDAATPLY